MNDFDAAAVINPYDDYGTFLVLALANPVLFRLVTWLMSSPGTELPPVREGLTRGSWVVSADDRFGREVAGDLETAGLDVHLVNPDDGPPDVSSVAGVVAGAVGDAANLSLAAHARLSNPDVYIALRQSNATTHALLTAFQPDSIFIPTELVAREVLAHITVPMSWSFIAYVLEQDENWAAAMTQRFVDRCGTASPSSYAVDVSRAGAPAVTRWLARHALTLGDLLRDCDDRDTHLAAVPIVLRRDDELVFAPSEETELQVGDVVVLAGHTSAFDALFDTLYNDSAVEHVATGRAVADTLVFRWIGHRRRARRGS